MANEEVKVLKRVEKELKEMNDADRPHHWLWRGMLQGAGWVIGSVIGIALIGWVLSIFGIIPGLDVLAHFFQGAFERARGL